MKAWTVIVAIGISLTASAALADHTPAHKATPAKSTAAKVTAPRSNAPPAHEPQASSEFFVERATMAGIFEIEAGKLALSRSKDPAVRDFAQKMVTEHSSANVELAAIAAKAPPALPVPLVLDADHKEKLQMLEKASAKSFDATYGKMMRMDHEQAVVLFTKAAEEPLVRAELREFATKTLPALQSHLAMASKLPMPASKPQ